MFMSLLIILAGPARARARERDRCPAGQRHQFGSRCLSSHAAALAIFTGKFESGLGKQFGKIELELRVFQVGPGVPAQAIVCPSLPRSVALPIIQIAWVRVSGGQREALQILPRNHLP